MNHRIAAPAKNRAPIIALSRALTDRAWDSKPLISAGKSQQTVPATAKTMARIILIGIASLPISIPPLGRRAAIRFDLAVLRKLAAIALAKVHECTEAANFVKKELTGGHLHIRIGTAKPYG
jgi:hypothetical protein